MSTRTFRSLNLFPFCVSTDPEDSAYAYIPMSLELAMAAYWRVKNWQVAAASFFYEIDIEEDPIEFDLGAAQLEMVSPEGGIASEESLVCGVSRQFSYDSDPSTEGYSPFCTFSLFPDARQAGSLVALAMVFRLGTSQAAETQISNPGDGAHIGDGILEFLGEQVPFPMYENVFTNVSGLDFKISAAEYWPYDPGDGDGPIYDPVTGAQLRPIPG
jgi:hypothetical protein